MTAAALYDDDFSKFVEFVTLCNAVQRAAIERIRDGSRLGLESAGTPLIDSLEGDSALRLRTALGSRVG
jgi:hypothetical protein